MQGTAGRDTKDPPSGHPLHGLVSWTVDWVTGECVVHGTDRAEQSIVPVSSQSERSILRSTFHVARSALEITLAGGSTAWVEIGRTRDKVDRPVVYLDQLHWVTLAQFEAGSARLSAAERPAAQRLTELALAGEIILPLSSAHLVETARRGGDSRVDLATTMVRLSQGWQMRSPLALRRIEMPSLLSSTQELDADCVRSWLFTLEPDAVWGPGVMKSAQPDLDLGPEVGALVKRLTAAHALYECLLERDSDYSEEGEALASAWAQSFPPLADHIRNEPKARASRRDLSRMRLVVDIHQDLAEVASSIGQTPEQFAEWLAGGAEAGFARIPALGRMRELVDVRLANADDVWQSNDLNDMMYLTVAAGYASVVVGEKKFTNLLARCTNVTPGAGLFRRLADALPAIEALVTA